MNKKIKETLIKNKFSPILLIESRYSDINDIIFSYIKSINCELKNNFCNECINCKKIDTKSYYDLNIIDGYKDNIHKEDVVKIINNFSSSSLENAGNKFLIIYGIENSNKFVINSLLKKIEDPNKNTFYIFTCRNSEKVLSTIKSRCQIFRILPDIERLKKQLIECNIKEEYIEPLVNMFFNKDEMIKNLEDETFLKILKISEQLNISQHNFSNLKNILNEFKKLTYLEIELMITYLSFDKDIQKKEEFLKLISLAKNTINKTLIFNQLTNLLF